MGVFLEARKKVIHWMHDEFGKSDLEISKALTTDQTQIRLIRTLTKKPKD